MSKVKNNEIVEYICELRERYDLIGSNIDRSQFVVAWGAVLAWLEGKGYIECKTTREKNET